MIEYIKSKNNEIVRKMAMPSTVSVGDTVMTKKPHPCGTNEWQVTRIGADIKLKCVNCGRIIMLSRADFVKRFKKYISRSGGNE